MVEFSGEHSTLPAAELEGALEALGGSWAWVVHEDRIGVVETRHEAPVVAHRIALAHGVHQLLLRGTPREVLDGLEDVEVPSGSVRVSTRLPSGQRSADWIEKVAKVLTRGRPVDLRRPDHEYRFILADQAYLVEVGAWVDRSGYEARRVARRAYHLPISLHPRLARALVNLSAVAPDARLLDPFVGTGGVLIEAAMVGARALGGDIRGEAVDGSRRALADLGLGAELRVGDVEEIIAATGGVDAVATDPPYGRSTTTRGEGVAPLLRRTLRALAKALPSGARVAVVLPGLEHVEAARSFFEVAQVHPLRVHRSLVRHFTVLRK